MAKLPADAFAQYVGMGAARTYEGLAGRLGVSKRTIVRHATKEQWQERLTRMTAEARERTDAKLTETLAAVDERHLRTVRAVQARGLEALKTTPLTSAAAAARVVDSAVKLERAILGRTGSEESSAGQTLAELIEASYGPSPAPPEPDVLPVALRPRMLSET